MVFSVKKLGLIGALYLLLVNMCFATAEFDVQYMDADGGFFSQTPAEPIGGNSGTTLGEQRRIALQSALDQFSKRLSTTIPIHIEAGFENMGGASNSAVLASAGPEWFNYDFTNAPQRNVAYPSALANKISQRDMSDERRGTADISLIINADIDNDALGSTTYYYGLDGQIPAFDISFIAVVTHEILHGLGYISAIDLFEGYKYGCGRSSCNSNNFGDIYSTFLAKQTQSGTESLHEMTQQARLAAVSANQRIVWTGAIARRAAQTLAQGTLDGNVLMFTPSPVQPGSSLAHLDSSLDPSDLMQPFYTGPRGLSDLNLSMLSDMGWGAAADLEVNLAHASTENGEHNANFTATLSNSGMQAAPAVQLELTTSAGRIQANNTLPCETLQNGLLCQIDTLAADQITSFDFRLRDTVNGTIQARLSGDIVEFNPNTNEDEIQIAVEPNGQQEQSSSTAQEQVQPAPQAPTSTSQDQSNQSPIQTQAPQVINNSSGGSVGGFLLLLAGTLLIRRVTRKLPEINPAALLLGSVNTP